MSRMRMGVTGGLIGVALTLVACGGGANGSSDSTAVDAKALMETSYIVQSITVDGVEREVITPVAISFTTQGIGVSTPCNPLSGPVTYDGPTLTIGPLASTRMACEPALMEQDQVLADALEGTPEWALADGRLTLTGGSTVIVAEALQLTG
ncbi:MAG: META domain-containing protein [Candidatus Nanopelagicales bacterium]